MSNFYCVPVWNPQNARNKLLFLDRKENHILSLFLKKYKNLTSYLYKIIISLLVNTLYPISKLQNFRKENSLLNSVMNKFKIAHLFFSSSWDLWSFLINISNRFIKNKAKGSHPKERTKQAGSVVTRRTSKKAHKKTKFICYPNS